MNPLAKSTQVKIEHHVLGGVRLEVHRIQAEDHAEIAISRILPRRETVQPFSVIMVHGFYSNRNFWISPKGVGLGVFLANNGFDVWIVELRGHGLSPKGDSFSKITAEDQIRRDLPAVQNYNLQVTGAPAFWIGHSSGGLFIIAALSAKWLDQDQIKGLVTFGSQISKGESYLKVPPVAWTLSLLLRIVGYVPAPKMGLGPELEAAGTILETIGWKKLSGKWINSEGKSYWDGLTDIKIPVMSFGGAKDTNDPAEGCKILHDQYGSADKIFILLGKVNRFSKDYDHVGMVVSKEAQTEVWPDVAGWMKDRS